jgi:hypothetical protein
LSEETGTGTGSGMGLPGEADSSPQFGVFEMEDILKPGRSFAIIELRNRYSGSGRLSFTGNP